MRIFECSFFFFPPLFSHSLRRSRASLFSCKYIAGALNVAGLLSGFRRTTKVFIFAVTRQSASFFFSHWLLFVRISTLHFTLISSGRLDLLFLFRFSNGTSFSYFFLFCRVVLGFWVCFFFAWIFVFSLLEASFFLFSLWMFTCSFVLPYDDVCLRGNDTDWEEAENN